MLDSGADVSIKSRGFTALDIASAKKDECPEMLTLLNGNIKSSDSRSHCTSTMATSSVEFLSSHQSGNRDRRGISNNSWMNNSVVNWVKGLASSTESPGLLTSREQNNHTVTAVPEINTTVVNNTIILGILTAGLFNKTQHKQPIHENLLSPREQSMRLNNIDEDMIMGAIQQGEKKFRDPDTKMDEVKISSNKTGMWKGNK